MIIQIDDALSGGDCTRLVEIYDRHAGLSKEQYGHLLDHAGDPILFSYQLDGVREVMETLRRVVAECSQQLIHAFGLPGLLYPETVILTRFGPGAYHPLHADNARQDEHGNWVPNHSPRRDLSAIYYLNEDFEGGELYFPRQHVTITPRTRLLVAFPGDGERPHEVLPVRTGVRYALPIWFTKQAEFGLPNLYRDGERHAAG